jgi:uncharacterized protein with HEPN domain
VREDRMRLADILQAMERIRGFTATGREVFYGDLKSQEAVAFEVLKIGEAASRVTPSFRRMHLAVPWKRLVDLRNALVHEYFRLEVGDLWAFVTEEMDELEKALRTPASERKAR